MSRQSAQPVPSHAPQHPDTRKAWLAVAMLPVQLVGGFVLGSILLGDPNAADAHTGWDGAWRVLLLWALLEVPPVLGIRWARHAEHEGDRTARTALVVNALVFLFFVLVTLVGGLSDALG
jgi:hypothetical protein